jgi:hypothetical protein
MILSQSAVQQQCAKTVKISHYIGSTDLWQQISSYLAITAISLTPFRLLQFSTSYKLHISENSSECTYAKLYHTSTLICRNTYTHKHINLLSS